MHVSVQGFVMVMEVLGLVFGVIGAFVIFFVFMTKKNEERYTGMLAKLYDFLNFRFYIIEGVLKFCYVLAACLCTAIGLFMALTVVELTRGLVLFVGGNLIARIVFEFIMMVVKACRNLGEIKKNEKSQVCINKKRENRPEVEVIYEKESMQEEKAVSRKTAVPQEAEVPQKTAVKRKIVIKKEPQTEMETAEEAFGRKPKYKVCPSCGEKCSSKCAFCNMCGTQL